jgi:hypothetical protein
MGEMRNAYKSLGRKHEPKMPLGRRRSRWKDITMDLKDVGWKILEWIHLIQESGPVAGLVNTVMVIRFI